MSEAIAELEGYDLVESPSLDLGEGFQCVRKERGTNTSGTYEVSHEGEGVGSLSLSFGLRNKKVAFDIEISRQGENLGITTLQRLAEVLSNRGFQLETGGISNGSRSYWEHLADKGQVVRIDPSDPNTQYIVPPPISSPVQAKV